MTLTKTQRFFICLIVPTLAIIGVSMLFAPIKIKKSKLDGLNLAQGQSIFRQRCTGCHSLVPGETGTYGPNLSSIGSAAPTRKSGFNGARYIAESVTDPDAFRAPDAKGKMPSGLTSDLDPSALHNLIGFLLSQGGQVIGSEVSALTFVPQSKNQDVKLSFDASSVLRGETLFLNSASCFSCHRFSSPAVISKIAPSPNQIATLAPDHIRDLLVNEQKRISSKRGNFNSEALKLAGTITHFVTYRGNYAILLTLDENGEVKEKAVDKVSYQNAVQNTDQTLLHNTFLKSKLKQQDIEDLVAFFKALE